VVAGCTGRGGGNVDVDCIGGAGVVVAVEAAGGGGGDVVVVEAAGGGVTDVLVASIRAVVIVESGRWASGGAVVAGASTGEVDTTVDIDEPPDAQPMIIRTVAQTIMDMRHRPIRRFKGKLKWVFCRYCMAMRNL
jgi:aspartokinase